MASQSLNRVFFYGLIDREREKINKFGIMEVREGVTPPSESITTTFAVTCPPANQAPMTATSAADMASTVSSPLDTLPTETLTYILQQTDMDALQALYVLSSRVRSILNDSPILENIGWPSILAKRNVRMLIHRQTVHEYDGDDDDDESDESQGSDAGYDEQLERRERAYKKRALKTFKACWRSSGFPVVSQDGVQTRYLSGKIWFMSLNEGRPWCVFCVLEPQAHFAYRA